MGKSPSEQPAEGSAGTLLMLHGGGPGVDAESNWGPVRAELSRSFRCLAPDLLGFGASVASDATTRDLRGPAAWAQRRARQVLDLMDAEGIDRAAVLGNSAAGGAAALALMGLAPERVERAVVMGGAGTGPLPPKVPFYDDPTSASMRDTLARLVADEDDHRDLIDALTIHRLENALRPGAEEAFRSMFEPNPADTEQVDLASIPCPVLALHGEQDRVSATDVSRRLADALPFGRLHVVEAAGHWIHVDRPTEFCRRVEEFLAA